MLNKHAGTTWFGVAENDYQADPSLSPRGVDPDCAHFVPRDSQLRFLPTEIAVHCLANSKVGSVENVALTFRQPSELSRKLMAASNLAPCLPEPSARAAAGQSHWRRWRLASEGPDPATIQDSDAQRGDDPEQARGDRGGCCRLCAKWISIRG